MVKSLRLPRYVTLTSGHLMLRSSLPDDHPDSWPSKVLEITGEPIPEDWRDRLVVPARHVTS